MTGMLDAELAAYHFSAGDRLLRRLRDLAGIRRGHLRLERSGAARATSVLMQHVLDETDRDTLEAALVIAITYLGHREG